MKPAHALLAAIVCVVLPALSWLDGYGFLAWTMYSGSSSYRLELSAIAADGSRHAVAPSDLARYAGHDEAPYLLAADRWRMISSRGLRHRLAEVGALACRVNPAEQVEVTLVTKRTLDAEAEIRIRRVRCDRPQP